MRSIRFIVVHHAASYDAKRARVVHQPVEVVTTFHTTPVAAGGRGFKAVGYNIYIERDGKIRRGRPDAEPGAHTEKLNAISLGVCCSGHADHEPFNPAQLNSLVAQCVAWCKLYKLTAESVIGHREAPRYGGAPVQKSCPGKLVDMDDIRARVRAELQGIPQGVSPPDDDDPPSTRRDGRPKAPPGVA